MVFYQDNRKVTNTQNILETKVKLYFNISLCLSESDFSQSTKLMYAGDDVERAKYCTQ